jgi:uncharacterized protein YgiM (DUF1202 family)
MNRKQMKSLLSSTFSFRAIMRLALCIMMTGIIILVSLFNPCAAEAAEDTFYVEVLVARIRQAPTTESPILFRARRGDPMVVDRKQGVWYHVKHPDGRTGWAHKKLFSATAQNSPQTSGRDHYINSVYMKSISNDKETIAFQLDSSHKPETFVLKGERPRVVCDFLNTRVLDSVGDRVEPEGTLVKDIRIAPYGGGAPRVRVVLDLTPGRNYAIDQTLFKKENRYVITVNVTAQ